MTSPTERARLVEQVVSAYRERDPHGAIRSAPAFHDLDEAGRLEAFEETCRARQIERAASPDGLTSTARAILSRLR